MGMELAFLADQHLAVKRDYLARVTARDKAACAEIAKHFDFDYWDGDRAFGYGGYHYDGRWQAMAAKLTRHYDLQPGQRVLDVGCGKGFLLYELSRLTPNLTVVGFDISHYALTHGKEEIRSTCVAGHARSLPFADASFDLVISLTTLHNLYCFDMKASLEEIQRVGRERAYLVVESYRNEREKANLLYWQLTCECFFTPREWQWWFRESGYTGDYEFIYFC